MSGPIFKSDRGKFNNLNAAFKDMLLGHMSMDIEIGIKTTAGTPVDTGNMKSQVRSFRASSGYRVEADAGYSAVQEAGRRAGSGPFQNYTTSGTSAGWFKRAVDNVWKNRLQYIVEVRKALSL